MKNELEVAVEAAREAGKILSKYFSNSEYWVKEKSHANPVTKADYEADSFLKSFLLDHFPNYGWLSEETKDSRERLTKKYTWIVDPLDGTKEFISGLPEFVISIGLVEDGKPILGVIFNPVRNELFFSELGKIPKLNDREISVTNAESISNAVIMASRTEIANGLWEPYRKLFKKFVHCGSVAYKLANIAAGNADIMVSLRPKHEWDICAGHFLIESAGGVMKRIDGENIKYNSEILPRVDKGIIAGGPFIVSNALKVFKKDEK
ncbi:MAG: 3'(2'),5'-bisphosphate nucleotidase CysQ [Candidatus Marinimicrobia bacterium]|nr:3'(2'),5'-bisphosphate nucleotidase CysQ [Candidatus Neomarinimicrobiota bacterium]MCD6099769.1 3'(2'),5'-bisphosphate nucleotidase CysQ [Candidatus Neomarinimicrobiota bacterium]